MMLHELEHEGELAKQSVGISLLLNQVLKLFMANAKSLKNCVSKLKAARIGKIF